MWRLDTDLDELLPDDGAGTIDPVPGPARQAATLLHKEVRMATRKTAKRTTKKKPARKGY